MTIMTPPSFAEVVFPVPMDKVFHYSLPAGIAPPLPGTLVNVPFGPRKKPGVIVGYSETPSAPADRLKPLETLLDPRPILSLEMLDLARWMSRRCACSLGEAVFSLLPTTSKGKASSRPKESGEGPLPILSTPEPVSLPSRGFTLTLDQKNALENIEGAIADRKHSIFLLWGVAAAGKTEIYMNAIRKALSAGGGVIYLVPEISLTAQALPDLEARFPGQCVVWHSGVSLSAKKTAWEALRSGEKRIVLGARSAVFAPVKDLRLIVVDEEHDPLYKEDSKPRAHARDVALERARRAQACVILGSATPSLESYKAAREGRFHLVELPERILGPAPRICVVDMKRERKDAVLSRSLKAALTERLKKREQSILFINRRGFYTFCRCPKCGWVLRCPSCGVPAVMHRKIMRCHYCIFRTSPPGTCPQCKQKGLWMGGMGTERVFSEIEKEFPWAKAVRWDTDTARKKGAHAQIFEMIKTQGVDILVGTKMVSQGLDLPGVTLVGIVDADVALYRPDFRAGERTFQLLVQTSGRSGRRDVQGEVVIQTRQPDHPAIRFAEKMDYRGFAEAELEYRRELNYPPCGRMAQLIFSGKKEAVAETEAQEFLVWVGGFPFSKTVRALGPAPAAHARRGGKARIQILLKGDGEDFTQAITAIKSYRPKHGVKFLIDVDPEELR
jgi:primosomal protein N' (replication factor Y)